MKQYEIWLVNLDPTFGSEPGKIRPALIVQSDILNNLNPRTTMICPITANVVPASKFLRLNIPKNQSGLEHPSDILIDQIRSVDNRRFIKLIGNLQSDSIKVLKANLKLLLDLEDE